MFKIKNNINLENDSFLVKNRRFLIPLVHLIQIALANYLAFVLRFESFFLPGYYKLLLCYLPILLIIRFIFYFQAGLHKNLLRYSSVNDLIKIINSAILGSIVFFIVVRFLIGDTSYPISIYILDWLLLTIFSCGNRLFIRVIHGEYLRSQPSGKRILLIGASDVGEKIVRDMKNNSELPYEPIGFIDDDISKKGLTIHGVPILGTISVLTKVIEKHKPDEILISNASSGNKEIKEVFELSKSFNIPIKKLPGLNDILNGNVSEAAKIGERLITANLITRAQMHEALSLQENKGEKLGTKLVTLGYITEKKLISFLVKYNGISSLKSISLEDLLQREPVETGTKSVNEFVKGKSVMVTGAGGSIGSELCRQLFKYSPSNLILFDRHENGLFKIDLELRHLISTGNGNFGRNITSVVGDILDTSTLEHTFLKHKPQIIFHAAAHKHVPLMEDNPIEAIKNNIFGTKNVIDASNRHKVENFVMISTDKAVNPTSVMGATKRIAEFLTINMNPSSLTKFTAVRFGNVLGSNGSVVTLFKDMLKKGGPLKVTHPEMKRYFMLIPEAVHLVIMAAASGNGGEIFVLDMGEQIKIVELAENLIRLSGFIPHSEVKIEYTGLRPGEKLYEELFDESEKVIPTFHKKIRKAIPAILPTEGIEEHISKLQRIIQNNSASDVIPEIQKIFQNFYSQDHVPESQLLTNKMSLGSGKELVRKSKRISLVKK